jgi:hypothetical protein
MFFNEVNLLTGNVLDSGIVDNWGYIYNAYYTLYLVDRHEPYREAARLPFQHLNVHYRDFNWENGGSDGFADAIESGINLFNRERDAELEQWINSEIRVMWSLQDSSYRERAQQWNGSGIIEGWHGDGNFARTTLMYCLWKTCGLTIEPWRKDVIFGAVLEGGDLYLTMEADDDWDGILRFDGERHKEVLHLPLDYPRINQFPEWFTILEHENFRVVSGKEQTISGSELINGLPVKLSKGKIQYMKISKTTASL